MTPERFDTLARLWAAAPSRRAFVLQVGGIVVYGALGRVGISIPRWAPPPRHPQCYPEREGVECGDCGICQRGQCVGFSDTPCSSSNRPYPAAGGARCARCVRGTGLCAGCAKEQKCCSDGCCDGPCTADGACCPPDKTCGDQCCRQCEVCRSGKCEKEGGESECPPNYTLIATPPETTGCCVCLRGLCGGKCCPEPEACLDGKCCKECGLDKAICCDDLICCRERCKPPSEPCCPCMEDISPEEGQKVLDRARKTMQTVKDFPKLRYGQDRDDPFQMDCTLFNAIALQDFVGEAGEHLSSRQYDGNCLFRRLKPGEAPRAGDALAQPRSSGPPGSQHTGIATGSSKMGGYSGVAMGSKTRAQEGSVWGRTRDQGGWFEGGFELRVYRPQKPCKKK